MVRKAQDNEHSGKRVAAKKASPRPRRATANAEAAQAAEPAEPPPAEGGAKALIRAGLKALGEVRGDMAARQARVFELLLGVGQSPAWPGNAGERARSLADPFGKFEEVFDQRVARSLERIGIPSPQVLQALVEQVKLLAEASERASAVPAGAADPAAKPAATPKPRRR
jgi:hypothetical protein